MMRLIGGACLLSVAAATDDTVLVQSAVNLHQEPAAPVEPKVEDCYCMHWDQAYNSGVVKYGDSGHELKLHSTSEVYKGFTHDYCMKAYKGSKFLGNGVVQPGEDMVNAAWCYVSSDCPNYRYGKLINDKVAWKNCDEGWEKRAADVPVKDMLAQIKKDGQMDQVRLVVTMSYPYSKQVFDEVEPLVTGGKGYAKAHELIMARHDSWNHQVQRSQQYPMIYCNTKGDLPSPPDAKNDGEICGGDHSFRMVNGKEVWSFAAAGEPVCERGCDVL